MPTTLSADFRDLLALHLVDGLGPQRISALLRHFGSASRARQARAAELLRVPGIGEQLSASIASVLPTIDVEAELTRLEKGSVEVLVREQPGYPSGLAALDGAPILLFARGTILPADERAVALVGTRHPDGYGKRVARQLAEGLARAGVTVVSGLARGIDGIAHQGALDAGGRTLAVLAGGLSRIYPPEHADLAARVLTAGAQVTESTMLAEPSRWRFPARNRIISGLSRLVVIVQAPTDSGALITAEQAAEQGRTVMAVPGLVDCEKQAGCHRLLREGAVVCRSVEDILEELDGVSATATATATARRERENQANPPLVAAPAGPPPGLDEKQRQVWEYLGAGPRAGDEIAREVGMPPHHLAGVLMTLEMNRVIRRLPGNRYERS